MLLKATKVIIYEKTYFTFQYIDLMPSVSSRKKNLFKRCKNIT